MRNKYPGWCYYCKKKVAAGKGHFERHSADKAWRVIHAECVFEQRKEKELLKKQMEEVDNFFLNSIGKE